MKTTACLICLFLFFTVGAQDTINAIEKNSFTLSGYADLYFQYDFNKPPDKLRPAFLYNFKKHDQLNVNLALFKGSFENKKLRANLGIMTGNYAKYNLAAEPEFFRYIYEVSVGYKFSNKLSADAGIFPSHIGCESAIAKDNWNLSRSMLAENSPYYESGIKLNYAPNDKWVASLLFLNGWQNIKDFNSSKAFGTQFLFKPNDKWVFNSSSFIGNEKPDSAKQLRLFHNLHITCNINTKLKALFMLDLGAERNIDKNGYNNWMGTALLVQYIFNKNLFTAGRLEYYKDKNGVIISNYLPIPFKAFGLAWNLDYHFTKKIVLRTEARLLKAGENIFIRNSIPVNSNCAWLSALAFYF